MNLAINPPSLEDIKNDRKFSRKFLICDFLEIEKWQELSNNINKFNPDVIILIQPKMPRIYQALQSLNIEVNVDPKDYGIDINKISFNLFEAQSIISNFAIDYLPNNYLNGKKIAIVDDSLNVGTTLKNVEEKINKRFTATQIKFFTVYQSESDHIVDVILSDNQRLTQDEYQEKSNCLASSLLCLPKPFASEFPIFTTTIPEDFYYKDFIADLKKLDLPLQFNRLDSLHYVSVGINKFSVDLFPGHGVNNKWYFCIDNTFNKLVFVPMAHYDPLDDSIIKDEKFLETFDLKNSDLDDDALHRLKSYVSSLIFEKNSWTRIKNVTSLPDICLDQNETELLFGVTAAEKILSFYNDLHSDYKLLQQPKDTTQTSYFYDAYTRLNTLDDSSKIKVESKDLFFNYFTKFFVKLGEFVGEDDKNNYKFDFENYQPNLKQVLKNGYLRLRVGPTFNELLRLMKVYFTNRNIEISEKALHNIVSHNLDRQIDQGFIVPTFDCYGRRIFRKGKSSPYNIYELKLLNLLGLNPTFTEMKNSHELLEPNQYDDIFSALQALEDKCIHSV